MDYLIIGLQLILSLSILVVLHELGHFIPAKLFGTRVEKFYLFFDPWFSLFKIKKGGTEYGVGWLPLGGYVKISGMIDESMDKEQMALPPKDWEFRAKPAWQRLIIMTGGVIVNLILGVLIYSVVAFTWGKDYVKNENITYGIEILDENLIGDNLFQNGDKIVTIDGEKVDGFNEVNMKMLVDQSKNFEVERNGEIVAVTISEQAVDFFLKEERLVFMPRFICKVDSVFPNTIASRSGLKSGDEIIGFNGNDMRFYDEFKKNIKTLKVNNQKDLNLSVLRGNDTNFFQLKLDSNYLLGFTNNSSYNLFENTHIDYSLGEAIPAGFALATNRLGSYIKQFKLIFTKSEAAKKVGGFGSMAKLFSNSWDWRRFWSNTAMISLILAFMNILPIPALDGGHVMFLLYEMVAGKKPNEQFMEKAQVFGMLLLLAVMLFANGNDLVRWLSGS